jgi:hypothetical protein
MISIKMIIFFNILLVEVAVYFKIFEFLINLVEKEFAFFFG